MAEWRKSPIVIPCPKRDNGESKSDSPDEMLALELG